MYYTIDKDKKAVFGFSPKAGCSHLKTLLCYLMLNTPEKTIQSFRQGESHKHLGKGGVDRVYDPTKYISNTSETIDVLIFTRHPFNRLVSGFVDKYGTNGQCRPTWPKHVKLNLSNFVKEIKKKNWSVVNQRHFEPQSVGYKDFTQFENVNLKIFDICNVAYEYISGIYNKTIPDGVMNHTQGHENRFLPAYKKPNRIIDQVSVDEYCDSKIDPAKSYSDDMKEEVYKIYKIDYDNFNYNINI